jgi:hypothetical protein
MNFFISKQNKCKSSLNTSLLLSKDRQHVSAIETIFRLSRKYILQCNEGYGQDMVLHQDGGIVRCNIH